MNLPTRMQAEEFSHRHDRFTPAEREAHRIIDAIRHFIETGSKERFDKKMLLRRTVDGILLEVENPSSEVIHLVEEAAWAGSYRCAVYVVGPNSVFSMLLPPHFGRYVKGNHDG